MTIFVEEFATVVVESGSPHIFAEPGATVSGSGQVFSAPRVGMSLTRDADPLVDPAIDPYEKFDVDGDGVLAPIDAVLVINRLNGAPSDPETEQRMDVDGDGHIVPLDALILIVALNEQSSILAVASDDGEGEAPDHVVGRNIRLLLPGEHELSATPALEAGAVFDWSEFDALDEPLVEDDLLEELVAPPKSELPADL